MMCSLKQQIKVCSPHVVPSGTPSYAYRYRSKATLPCSSKDSRSVLIPIFSLAARNSPLFSARRACFFIRDRLVCAVKFRNRRSKSCPPPQCPCSMVRRHFKYSSSANASLITAGQEYTAEGSGLSVLLRSAEAAQNASAVRKISSGSNERLLAGLLSFGALLFVFPLAPKKLRLRHRHNFTHGRNKLLRLCGRFSWFHIANLRYGTRQSKLLGSRGNSFLDLINPEWMREPVALNPVLERPHAHRSSDNLRKPLGRRAVAPVAFVAPVAQATRERVKRWHLPDCSSVGGRVNDVRFKSAVLCPNFLREKGAPRGLREIGPSIDQEQRVGSLK